MHPQAVCHIAALKKVFSRGVSILLTPAHETQPRQNPVLLIPSRADNGSQSISLHFSTLPPFHHSTFRGTTTFERLRRETKPKTAATYRDMSCRQTRQIGDNGKSGMVEKWKGGSAAFEYPLADRPLRRSRYGRCARKPMGKKSAAAIHRRTIRLRSITPAAPESGSYGYSAGPTTGQEAD